MSSLVNNETLKFMNTGVDLGDGTYAVRFVRNGVTTFVRVDGDLPNNYYTHAGASGNIWRRFTRRLMHSSAPARGRMRP